MLEKNDNIDMQRSNLVAFYERFHNTQKFHFSSLKFYATKVDCNNLIINKDDAITALNQIGYQTPNFLGIVVFQSEPNYNCRPINRVFLKFEITPELYAFATLANSTLFITQKRYDKTKISFPNNTFSDEKIEFYTTIIYQKNNLPVFDKNKNVRVKFCIQDTNLVLKEINSTFIPTFTYEPEQYYTFSPTESDCKVKQILKEYYLYYFIPKIDLIQDLPNHYTLKA